MEKLNIVNWKIAETVASDCNISCEKANKVIKLINDGSTIPFIARYRKEYTGNMAPTMLHKIKEKMEECRHVIEHVEKSMKTIERTGMLTENLKTALQSCKTIDDIAFVTEPFKQKGPKTLAGRARQAGLEPLALKILYELSYFTIEDFIPRMAFDEFKTLENIEQAIKNIVADIFAKDLALLESIEKLNCPTTTILSSSLKKKFSVINPKEKIDDQTLGLINKLKNYHNFAKSLMSLRPHQIMAINRGEKNKILKVTITFPTALKTCFIDLCNKKYIDRVSPRFRQFLDDCVSDAYERLMLPHLIRKIRNQLTKKAQNDSLDVFETNLRQLVMSSPLRGNPIIGIDPGFHHGCKVAVIDNKSQLLDTAVLYLKKSANSVIEAESVLIEFVLKYNVEYIAIGDGCGNDSVTKFVSTLISKGAFQAVNVRFAIVRECGASVYSISPESEKEFPFIDPNIRSAISIARRLQDPLAEYVKMDPKCLGVGMYQHDLPSKSLVDKVNVVLDECISFVGVDINHAPLHILQHVSGLGPVKAQSIIEYREQFGRFRNRKQLLNVKGIGDAIFVQCAGFIRVKPQISSTKSQKYFEYEPDGDAMMTDVDYVPKPRTQKKFVKDTDINPLDQTAIHPESYHIAESIIQLLNLESADIGTTAMQQATKAFMANNNYMQLLSNFKTETCGLETLQDIIICLSRPLEFDERHNFSSSMLRQSCGLSSDLRINQKVTGFVHNVTTFGLFIDIGVEQAAFCHKLFDGIILGDVVECTVTFIGQQKLNVDNIKKIAKF